MEAALTLQPAADPGHYINPDWTPGTAGTFALVVGVSRYLYLGGGPLAESGSNTFGLGQLHVSALTAHRFFEWMGSAYANSVAPVAQCWLLLSPAQVEAEAEPRLGSAVDANIANAEKAVRAWYGAMKALPRPAAEQSRAVFFFSGHGIEVQSDRQLLLPTDYLEPPVDNLNDAISTTSLLRGLGGLAISQVLFFLDACRNDVPALRNFEVTGRNMLPVPVAAETNPDQVSLLYYAAASGQQTWQPFEVKEGASVFGRALFDGLVASPGMELRCGESLCAIDSFPLHAYLKRRVAAILADYQSQERARVRMGGSVDDFTITSLPPPRKVTRSLSRIRATRPIEDTLADRYTVHHPHLAWEPLTSDFDTSYQLLGSEKMTRMWEHARVSALSDNRTLQPHQLRITGVDRSEDTRTFRFELDLPADPVGHWLQFTAPNGEEWACVLGGDAAMGSPRYSLEMGMEIATDQEGWWISRMESGLTANNQDPWGRVARIWEIYENFHLGGAVDQIDHDWLEQVLQSKQRSPLSATVAGTILLRARRWDLLHQDWLANLARWFQLPDGPVLWSEQVRLTQGWTEEAIAERRASLGQLNRRGLPHLAEVLALASAALADLEARGVLTAEVAPVVERVRSVTPLHRPGGLFAVFAGPPGSLHPNLLGVG